VRPAGKLTPKLRSCNAGFARRDADLSGHRHLPDDIARPVPVPTRRQLIFLGNREFPLAVGQTPGPPPRQKAREPPPHLINSPHQGARKIGRSRASAPLESRKSTARPRSLHNKRIDYRGVVEKQFGRRNSVGGFGLGGAGFRACPPPAEKIAGLHFGTCQSTDMTAKNKAKLPASRFISGAPGRVM